MCTLDEGPRRTEMSHLFIKSLELRCHAHIFLLFIYIYVCVCVNKTKFKRSTSV